MPNEKDLRATLKESMNEAEWTWLIPHMEREALIIVSQELDIVEVGVKIIEDDTAQVQEWVTAQQIGKPTEAQTKAWDSNPSKRFVTLIVQPYVLAQERAH